MSSTQSISMTAGGIDASAIVASLMAVERQPLTALQNRQNAAQLQIDGIAKLRSALDTLKSQAAAIISGGLSKLSTATTSSAISASITGSARAGSLSFTVDRLAQSSGFRTASMVTSSSAVVTTAAALAVSTTSNRLGIGNIGVGAGVSPANYTVSVVQATAGATVAGTAPLAPSTLIDGSNNTLDVTIDGVARSLNIAAGTYNPAGMVTAVQTALDATGGGATASLDASGRLQITTTHEGSAATLQITGGTSLASLNLIVTMPASVGVDGSVKIGTNPAVTVTSAGSGGVISVSTGTGTLDLQLTGGLRVGDSKVAVVSTGDRSLSAVAAAINGANVGATASAVKTAEGSWLLQVNSSRSGTANQLSIDPSAFAAAGGLVATSAAQDAQITIGTGPGAYTVTASGNTFTDVMPGVTITANQLSAAPVSVNVNRDDAATADTVSKLVDQANALLAEITAQTKYDPSSGVVAPLASNAIVRGLAADARAAITSLVGGGGMAGTIGISTLRDGTLKFDRAAFTTALTNDADAVERLFDRHGAGSPGITWAGASDSTAAGSYAVNVTQAATRATTGVVLAGGSPGGQVIGVRIGGTTVTYTATAGASADDITAGLNAALATSGIKVAAESTGGGVRLTAIGYGAALSFETNLDVNGAGTWNANAGTDVAGTINGEPAIGIGQRLSLLSLGTSPARGIAVDIGEGLTGALGNVDYQPGIAARLVTLATGLTSVTGALTSSTFSYDAKVKSYNAQIEKFEARMIKLESNYRRQWSVIQTTLSSLENQQSWLTSQINSLSGNKDS